MSGADPSSAGLQAHPAGAVRADIQALRGWAVLVVVLYHVQLGPFDAGYLGVDIFFVISGFLITTLIAQGLGRGNFSLLTFYERRAKRLLPAAYGVMLATVLAAPWLLSQQELRDLAMQVVGAVTFTANFVFWQQTDYFGGQSDFKPLLHTWSLAVEEQYYMLLPGLLLLVRRSWWMRVVLALLVVSLSLCVVGVLFKPVATFYLLPTRAWQLLVGSVGALWALREGASAAGRATAPAAWVRRLYLPALAALAALPLLRIPGPHPGLAALLVCTATLVVILRGRVDVGRAWPVRGLVRLGDWSYSLYLVHWPLMALLRNAWAGAESELPLGLRCAVLAASLVMAYLLHRHVEVPVRRSGARITARRLLPICLVSAGLMSLTPMLAGLTRHPTDYGEIRRANFGLADSCDYEGETVFQPRDACRSGGDARQARVMLWGDSYAMHLAAGLATDPTQAFLQATQSGCGPLAGVAPRRLRNRETGLIYDRAWAVRCMQFNRSVLDHLRAEPGIDTVILSSALTAYVDGAAWHLIFGPGGDGAERPSNPGDAARALTATVAELRAMGKKVVLIAPPPVADFNVGGCVERYRTGRLVLGATEGCRIAEADYRSRRKEVLAAVDAIEQQGTPVLRFDALLCDGQFCRTEMDGVLLYRDAGHFTYQGSALMARRMGLMHQALTLAR